MAKKYFNAQMHVVRMSSDIVTASNIGVGNTSVTNGSQVQGPGRKSIWD